MLCVLCCVPVCLPADTCRYAFCPNLTIIDTPGFILKVRQLRRGCCRRSSSISSSARSKEQGQQQLRARQLAQVNAQQKQQQGCVCQ